MKYTSLTLILLCCFGYGHTYTQVLDSVQIARWISKSYQFQDSGRYDSAIYYMDLAAMWSNPDTTGTYPDMGDNWLTNLKYELSKLYLYQGDYQQANSILQYLLTEYQSRPAKDSIYGEILHNLGMLNYNINAYQEAGEYLDKSLQIKQQIYGELHESTANTYNLIGNLVSDQGNFDKAREYYMKALDIRKQILPEDHSHISDTYQNLGILAYSEGDYDEAIRYMMQGFEIEKRILPPNHPNLAGTYNNLGVMFDIKGNYEKALEYYDNALKIRREIFGDQHQLVAQLHHNIGVVYQEMGLQREAMDSYVKALYMYRQTQVNAVSYEVASILENIGTLYFMMDNFEEALKYQKEALALNKQLFGEIHPEIGVEYFNLSRTLIKLGEYNQARIYLKRAEALDKLTRPEHPDRALVYASLGEWYYLQGEYDSSYNAYQQSINILQSELPAKHPSLARIYNEWAQSCKLEGKKTDALNLYSKAILVNVPGFHEKEIFLTPPKDISPLGIPEYLESIHEKALLCSENVSDTALFMAAIRLWDIALNLLDQVQTQYSYRQSKLDLRKQAREIYEAALQAYVKLYNKTKDPELLYQAFNIAEKAQSALLHEWIQEVQARSVAGISPELLDKENSLRASISFYEKQVYDLQNQPQEDSSKLLVFRARLFDQRSTYDSLITEIEKQYPQYYEMKYSIPTTSISKIQSLLAKDEQILRYFMTPEVLYTFVVTRNQLDLYTQEIDSSFANSIAALYKSFQNFGWDESQWDAQLRQYSDEAYRLYQILLAPVIDETRPKLRVIPDGIIGFIPFEALLYDSVAEANGYNDLPFLIEKYEISYAYSVSLLASENNSARNTNGFMGFAPDYSQVNIQLASAKRDLAMDSARLNSLNLLAYNQPEVDELAAMMEGLAYLGMEASETNFKQIANRAGIIHLAMHTLLDDNNPLYSGLIFSQQEDTAGEDNFLHTYELFNMNLTADLVVLSACNTGIGQLQRGEGMLSLARAFRYAGCPNLVLTLWQTDDQAAYHVMQEYYQALNKGLTYPEALRTAKLQYINSQDQVHPFYWANFIYVGKTQGIPRHDYWKWIVALCILGIIGYGGWRYFYKKNKKFE